MALAGFVVDDALVENDAILPSQFFAGRREVTPERELLVAIFHDAINCVLNKRPHDRPRLEAIEWFNSPLIDHPTRFTFLYLCSELGYDPKQWRTFVRAQVLNQTIAPTHRKIAFYRHPPRGLRTRML